MNFRILLLGLLSLNLASTYAHTDLDIPTRGKIYHPGDMQQFNDTINKFDLVIVDFYADWCGPCKQMHKVLDDLATDRDCEDILIIKVDTQQQHSLSNRYNITSLPTLMFFVDGKPINVVYGYHTKKQMKELITKTFRIPKA